VFDRLHFQKENQHFLVEYYSHEFLDEYYDKENSESSNIIREYVDEIV
jgi:hypothetical protein